MTRGQDEYNGARILIVDDEEANVILLERMLSRAGYTHLTGTQDSRRVLSLVQETNPDLVLLDLLMPHLDGYEVMSQLNEHLPAGAYLPILVLTADVNPLALQRALSGGAKDFLTKPFDQTELLLRVRNLLETRFLYRHLQRQLDTLESINVQAQQAISVRDESLSTISHDFGQPLAAVRFTTEFMQERMKSPDAIPPKELAEDLQRIEAASNQMAAMISEMSDLARLQMGRGIVLQRRKADLVSLAKKQVEAVQKSTRRHRVRLDARVDTLIGEWDEMRLTRVISNLLTNAIKFSPNGGEVIVSIHVEEDDVDQAAVSVKDAGVGIPAADLEHVFEPFYRAGNVVNRIEGTGVGLASAKQIVEQHGGSITVESEEGHGTTVTLRLPIGTGATPD